MMAAYISGLVVGLLVGGFTMLFHLWLNGWRKP